jgi:hypothetical protein
LDVVDPSRISCDNVELIELLYQSFGLRFVSCINLTLVHSRVPIALFGCRQRFFEEIGGTGTLDLNGFDMINYIKVAPRFEPEVAQYIISKMSPYSRVETFFYAAVESLNLTALAWLKSLYPDIHIGLSPLIPEELVRRGCSQRLNLYIKEFCDERKINPKFLWYLLRYGSINLVSSISKAFPDLLHSLCCFENLLEAFSSFPKKKNKGTFMEDEEDEEDEIEDGMEKIAGPLCWLALNDFITRDDGRLRELLQAKITNLELRRIIFEDLGLS